jgi:ATP synthase protein I
VWGKEDLDPVGNTDDFIWNKDFLPHMERVVSNGGADTALAITRLAPVPRLPSFDPFVAL